VTITWAGCCSIALAALLKLLEPGCSAGSWYVVSKLILPPSWVKRALKALTTALK